MKSNASTPLFSFSGVVCSTFGHQFNVTRKVTNHINEYRCRHCGQEVTDNFSGTLEILTLKNKEINATLASFFEKKTRRRYTAA